VSLCKNKNEKLILIALGLSRSWTPRGSDSHDLITELLEKSSLSRFCHEVSDHVLRRTPFDREVLLADPISYKIVSDVDMLRALTARCFAVLLHENGALVVLIDNVFADCVSLCFQEIARPQYCWHAIIHANDLGFRGAPCVELLLRRSDDGHSSTHRDATTCVASHVRMDSERRVDPPFQYAASAGAENQW
jgi:hypothetical protein